MTMRMLSVPLLLCAVMVWTTAAAAAGSVVAIWMNGKAMQVYGICSYSPIARMDGRWKYMYGLVSWNGEHAVVKRCPNDWIEWNGHCYILEKAVMAWADAEKTCVSQGGNLASIHYKRETTFIQDLLPSSTGLAWIGGYDATGTNGAWLWSDGSPMTFTDWNIGQPNNNGGQQNCMAIRPRSLWDDTACKKTAVSVCKKRAESAE